MVKLLIPKAREIGWGRAGAGGRSAPKGPDHGAADPSSRPGPLGPHHPES